MFSYITNVKLETLEINRESILALINQLNVNKAHSVDQISVQMIKLCGNSISRPLQIIFTNIVFTGIIPGQLKMANVTPVHRKKISILSRIIGPYPVYPSLPKYLKDYFSKQCIIIFLQTTSSRKTSPASVQRIL